MNFSDDREFWMSNLPDSIRNRFSIINLAIPGSHDSFTYGINKNSKLGPDAEEILHQIFPFVPCVVRRWSKTQKYTIEDQLKSGIRYFDLRIAVRAADQDFYFVHGLFSEKIKEPLEELDRFLDDHPKEFVILDLQHFYNFSPDKHCELVTILLNLFKSKIFEKSYEDSDLGCLTLSHAFEKKKQLMIIYRNGAFSPETFFPSYDFPTPWPQTTSISELKAFLEKRLSSRMPHQGFVTQCLLTPDVRFILPRFYSSLRNKCARKVDKEMSSWIAEQSPGEFSEEEQPKSNVFLADFVDIRNDNFCKTVIDLNMKLLSQTNEEQTILRENYQEIEH